MEQLKFKKLDYSVKKEDGTEEIKNLKVSCLLELLVAVRD